MKKLTLILVMFISSITFAQDCDPAIQENCPTVFDFECGTHITDGVLDDDRNPLLLDLGNINITIHFYTNPANTDIGAHDHITIKDSYNAVHTSFYLSGIKLEDNYDYGETQVKNLTPENFKKLYVDIENILSQI